MAFVFTEKEIDVCHYFYFYSNFFYYFKNKTKQKTHRAHRVKERTCIMDYTYMYTLMYVYVNPSLLLLVAIIRAYHLCSQIPKGEMKVSTESSEREPGDDKTLDNMEMTLGGSKGEESQQAEVVVDQEDESTGNICLDALLAVGRCIASGVVASVMILFLIFYGAFYMVYKCFGSCAGCCYDQRNCCGVSNGRKPTQSRNPCGICLRLLIQAIFYSFFAVLGSVSYVFYMLSLGPLKLLALISDAYALEYKEYVFHLRMDDVGSDELDVAQGDPAAQVAPSPEMDR